MIFLMLVTMCLAPLPALLLMSVGLVILKRRPTWMARLAAPPFYLVSLPIATLIAGAAMLGLYFRLLLLGFSGSFFFKLLLNSTPYYFFRYSVVTGHYFHVLVGSFIGFWIATFVSGYLLWQAVWRQDDHPASSRVAGQRLRGLILLICFAWAFFYLVTYFAELSTPLGISDPR